MNRRTGPFEYKTHSRSNCRSGPSAATTARIGLVIRKVSFCSLAAAAALRGLRTAPWLLLQAATGEVGPGLS